MIIIIFVVSCVVFFVCNNLRKIHKDSPEEDYIKDRDDKIKALDELDNHKKF